MIQYFKLLNAIDTPTDTFTGNSAIVDNTISGNIQPDFEITIWDNIKNLLENEPSKFFFDCLILVGVIILIFTPAIVLKIISKKRQNNDKSDK